MSKGGKKTEDFELGESNMQVPEKRVDPRAATRAVIVKVNGSQHQLFGLTRDISRSGMGLRTFAAFFTNPIDVGDRVRLEFRLPESGQDVECEAEVVWSGASDGGSDGMIRHGLRFTGIEPCIKEEIMARITERP